MIANTILIIFSLLFIITAVVFFIKTKFFIYNENKIIRRFPLVLTIAMGVFLTISTIYFDIKRDKKVEEFNALKSEGIKIDTSMNKEEILSAPVDSFSYKRFDTFNFLVKRTDSIKNKISIIKDYLTANNIFSKVDPQIQDSVKRTYESIKEKQKMLDQTNILNGYVYGGVSNGDSWIQGNFKNVSFENRAPRAGDMIECISPIFIRVGPSHNTAKGWENQRLLGTMKVGRRVIVREIVLLPNNYFWIRF